MEKSEVQAAPKQKHYEVEEQIILRLPPEVAAELRHEMDRKSNLKDHFFIALDKSQRIATVTYEDRTLSGKVVDLPCIIESVKTVDRKNFLKTGDISQMLLCTEEKNAVDEEKSRPEAVSDEKPQRVDKRFQFAHGITPPMRGVRKHRFRKPIPKKRTDEASEILKEVRRLLLADLEAKEVRWDILREDEISEAEKKKIADATTLFGEVSSSSSSGSSSSSSGSDTEASRSSESDSAAHSDAEKDKKKRRNESARSRAAAHETGKLAAKEAAEETEAPKKKPTKRGKAALAASERIVGRKDPISAQISSYFAQSPNLSASQSHAASSSTGSRKQAPAGGAGVSTAKLSVDDLRMQRLQDELTRLADQIAAIESELQAADVTEIRRQELEAELNHLHGSLDETRRQLNMFL